MYMYTCIYVYMYTCIYVYIYIQIHTHTHTHSSCENSLTSLRRVWVCVCVCVERGMSPLTHAPYFCRTNGRERVLAMTHKSTGYDTPRVLPMTRLECCL